jgi:hypothetical protein
VRVLVFGNLDWYDFVPVIMKLRALVTEHPGLVVIEGGARGADTAGRLAGFELGCSVETYQAEWSKYGRAAGPIRNQRMVDEGRPDLALACYRSVPDRGTADMLRRLEEANVPVERVSMED